MTAQLSSPSVRSPADPEAGRVPGLDGLRALAVIAVLGFHLWPTAVPGGFLGVDVFFVISGFLITTLLLRERNASGGNDLAGFWTRRARRLLPAIVLVVTTCVALARVVSGNLLVDIQRQVLGAMTFSTNWIEIATGGNYFDHAGRSLFVTFWSLAVEEQFYIVWPLLFIALVAATRVRMGLWRVAWAMAACSALLMAVLFDPGAASTRVYYGTDTHGFGLMVGVALAFAFSEPVKALVSPRWQRIRSWLGFTALGGLVLLVLNLDSDSPFTYRGGIQLASVLAVLVVAALPGDPAGFASMFHARPLVWVGRRSYGIYLWHWPLLLIISAAMPATAPGAPPNPATVVLVLAATMALSEASYRWLELPVIRNGFRATLRSTIAALREADSQPRRRSYLVASGSLVLIAVAAVALATAPRHSAAQRSVETGQAAIAAQPVPEAGSNSEAGTVPEADGSTTSIAPPPAWPVDLATPPGDRIVGFGDSVMSGAAPALYDEFPGIYLDAEPIRRWTDAPPLVESALAAGTMRNVVILNYGTNAGLKSEASRQALHTVLDLLGPQRRVVLVTIVGVSSWVPASNETLREVSSGYPNTIIADWYAAVQNRPDLLHDDRTHPNTEGISVYADLIAQSLRELGPG